MQQIAEWLQKLDLGQYAQRFAENEIDEVLKTLFTLNDQGVTVVMIEHIMYAVMKFAQRICVLVAGRKIADGDPQAVIRDPEVERAYLGE